MIYGVWPGSASGANPSARAGGNKGERRTRGHRREAYGDNGRAAEASYQQKRQEGPRGRYGYQCGRRHPRCTGSGEAVLSAARPAVALGRADRVRNPERGPDKEGSKTERQSEQQGHVTPPTALGADSRPSRIGLRAEGSPRLAAALNRATKTTARVPQRWIPPCREPRRSR
jgi:hypothetical protein